jgi:hypothetical protein
VTYASCLYIRHSAHWQLPKIRRFLPPTSAARAIHFLPLCVGLSLCGGYLDIMREKNLPPERDKTTKVFPWLPNYTCSLVEICEVVMRNKFNFARTHSHGIPCRFWVAPRLVLSATRCRSNCRPKDKPGSNRRTQSAQTKRRFGVAAAAVRLIKESHKVISLPISEKTACCKNSACPFKVIFTAAGY